MPRLEVGHYDDALLAAWKVLAKQLQLLTGSDEDGAKLVNMSFGRNGPIQLGDESARGQDEQQGYFELFRALAHLGRNVSAHRLDGSEAPELETATLLLVAGMCARRLETYAAGRPDS